MFPAVILHLALSLSRKRRFCPCYAPALLCSLSLTEIEEKSHEDEATLRAGRRALRQLLRMGYKKPRLPVKKSILTLGPVRFS